MGKYYLFLGISVLFLVQRFYNDIVVNELIGIKKYEMDCLIFINIRIKVVMEYVLDRIVLCNLGLEFILLIVYNFLCKIMINQEISSVVIKYLFINV